MNALTKVSSLRFDVSQENEHAYHEWIRNYRLLLSFALVLLVGLDILFALALVGSPHLRAHVPVGDYWIVASWYAMAVFLGCLMAYGVFWLYRPGARCVEVTFQEIRLEYADGRSLAWQWASPNFRLRISATGSVDSRSNQPKLLQMAIQSLHHPHFELNEGALSAILSTARANNLDIRTNRTPWPGNGFWDRIFISPHSSQL